MPEDRFFKLLDHVGLEPDGSLQPLVEVGITVPRLTMIDGEPVQLDDVVRLKPVEDGSRIFSTEEDIIAEGLLATGLVEEISPPTRSAINKDKAGTQREPTRNQLNTRAEELGVENPQKLANKEAVVAAIAAAESAAAGSTTPTQEA